MTHRGAPTRINQWVVDSDAELDGLTGPFRQNAEVAVISGRR